MAVEDMPPPPPWRARTASPGDEPAGPGPPAGAEPAPVPREPSAPGGAGAAALPNRGTQALAPTGWAIYYSALHGAQPGTIGSGFTIEDLTGDLHRLVPAAGFAGLAPAASVRIPYLTHLLLNRSFAPQGPYIVFDDAKDVGVPLSDYVAVPFERPPQGEGRDPRVVSAENQFALDSLIRDILPSELPPVFPTPVELSAGAGSLHLAAMPSGAAPRALRNQTTVPAGNPR